MARYQYSRCCRALLSRSGRLTRVNVNVPKRSISSRQPEQNQLPEQTGVPEQTDVIEKNQLDIKALLSKPTWSVRSLLPGESGSSSTAPVAPSQLHHLLRLSALPQPKTPEEEEQMLKTLESQLHFVKEIQSVDTTGIEPLQALREETEEAVAENTIGMDALREAFANEEVKGRNRRPRRRRDIHVDTNGAEEWDVMGTAERTVGKYFVVNNSNK